MVHWCILVLVTLVPLCQCYQVLHDDGTCSCSSLEIVTTSEDVNDKHAAVMGSYRFMINIIHVKSFRCIIVLSGLRLRQEKINNRPSYVHSSGSFYLFYNDHSQVRF